MQIRCFFKIYTLLVLFVGSDMCLHCFAQDGEELSVAATYLGYDDIYREFKRGKCKSCHPAIWREWESSMHGQAWKDPIYQRAASEVADRENKCDPCHAPEPVLITGIGKMPKLRAEDRSFGVSCLVCHIDAHGAMHGPPSSIDAVFHANVTDEIYADSTELCGTCHGQPSVPEHNQLASFKGSPADKAGKSCSHCHMPRVKRLQSTRSYSEITGRRHTWIGSRSVRMLKRGADLSIMHRSGKVVISLTNRAGHILPGDALRVLTLDVHISEPVHAIARESRVFISARSGHGGSDNRLRAGETREFEYPVSAEVKVDAKLVYRLTADAVESEWVVMLERSHYFP